MKLSLLCAILIISIYMDRDVMFSVKAKRFFAGAFSAVLAMTTILFLSGAAYATSNLDTDMQYADGSEISQSRFLADYTQTVYNERNGMFSAEVNGIYQSDDGYIWIATYGGLMRYDGNDFSLISKVKDGYLPNISAMDVCEGADGSIWVATNGNGILVLYKDFTHRFIDTDDGLPSLSVRSVKSDSEGNIYAGTTDGICRIDANCNTRNYLSTKNMFIRDIEIGDDNSVYAVASDGYLVCIEANGNIIAKKYEADFTCLLLKPNSIQIGTSTGNIANVTYNNGRYNVEYITLESAGEIHDIYRDADGNVWLMTDKVLGMLSENNKLTIIDKLAFSSNFNRIIQDRDKNYWISSDKYGIIKAVKSRFTDFGFEYGLPETVVNSIVIYNRGYYIGTDDGLFVVRNGALTETELTKRLAGVRIRQLFVDSDNLLRIATYGENTALVTLYPDGKFEMMTTLPNCKIRNVNQLADGSLIIGTANGAYVVKDKKITEMYTTSDGMTNTVILCTCQDKNGTVYVGTDGGGIYTVKDGEMNVIDESDGLDGEVILRMVYDEKRDVVWVSTGNNVMYLKDGKVFKADSNKIHNNVFDFVIIGDNIWLTSSNALYVINADDMLTADGAPSMMSIPQSYGLSSSICSNSWNCLSDSGMLYLCCIKGVNSVDTSINSLDSYMPGILLSNVVTDSTEYYNADTISLPCENQRVTINLSVLNYVPSDGITVRYYLEGQDSATNTVNSNDLSSISYTNLSGGSYVFHLDVIDSDGLSYPAVTVNFNKDYYFFEQPLVIIGMVVIAALILTLIVLQIIRHRDNLAMKRQNELKNILNQAIAAITNTIDAKDAYTSGHSTRVAKYSVRLGKHLKLGKSELEDLYYTALLHDVGKIGVPDSVLNKPGRLTAEEFEIMKQHTTIGGEILSSITAIKDISLGAKQHHEKWDGNGYTEGLSGENICLNARIICVADSFDAMATNRAYRKHLDKETVINEFTRCTGTQFDPAIAKIMLEMISSGEMDDAFTDDASPEPNDAQPKQ